MARFTSIGMPRKTFVASTAEEAEGAAPPSSPPAAGPSSAVSAGEEAPKKKVHRGGKRLKAKLQRQAAVAAGEIPAPVPTAPKEREEGDMRGKNKNKKRKAEAEGGDSGYGGRVREVDGYAGRQGQGQGQGQEGQGGWGRDASIAKKTRFSEDRAEHRRIQRIEEKKAALTCFACRGSGHSARDCPNGGKETAANICYRCGSDTHSLKDCRKPTNPSNPTPFASCYVCSNQGHLSSQCPDNAKGVYVKGNGGKCKICNSVRHLVADCPELALRQEAAAREADKERMQAVEGEKKNLGADEDDWMAESRVRAANGEIGQQQGKKGKGMEKKPFNNNGLRRPYKEGEMVGRETEGFAEGVEGKVVKAKKAKVVAF